MLNACFIKRVELIDRKDDEKITDVSNVVTRVSLDASGSDVTTVTLTIPACYVMFNGHRAVSPSEE